MIPRIGSPQGRRQVHEAPATEIRAYVVAMSRQLADLAAQIGREDIELKLREAVKAGSRSI